MVMMEATITADHGTWPPRSAKGVIGMDQKNLDIYGNEPIPWSRPLAELEKFEARSGSEHLARDDPSRWPAASCRGRCALAPRQHAPPPC